MGQYSFQEVMAHFKRMCEYYQREHECPMGCIMSGMNRSQCMREAFEKPVTTEKTIMQWAAEHPEPVYPTWLELAAQQGFKIEEGKQCTDEEQLLILLMASVNTPIPADLAQKLGIEPKEGV